MITVGSDLCEGVGVVRRTDGGDCRCWDASQTISSGAISRTHKRFEALWSMDDGAWLFVLIGPWLHCFFRRMFRLQLESDPLCVCRSYGPEGFSLLSMIDVCCRRGVRRRFRMVALNQGVINVGRVGPVGRCRNGGRVGDVGCRTRSVGRDRCRRYQARGLIR